MMDDRVRAIYDKCTDVISSCRNEMQMNSAANYKELAIKRLRELSNSPGNRDYSEQY